MLPRALAPHTHRLTTPCDHLGWANDCLERVRHSTLSHLPFRLTAREMSEGLTRPAKKTANAILCTFPSVFEKATGLDTDHGSCW